MEQTGPKAFVFVLMPFSDKFQDVYEVGIKSACTDAGAYCERVDEQIFTDSILDRIFNQIAKADVIVADMTGRNPNVFYETGYAHALNKRVILLTQKAADIPFDLKHYPHIVYQGKLTLLKAELERKIRWCIENPLQPLSDVDLNLEFSIDGKPVEKSAPIEINGVNYCDFTIGVHNPLGKVIKSDLFAIALISSKKVRFFEPTITSAARLTNDGYIYTLSDLPPIFPFGWASYHVVFEILPVKVDYLDLTLRFFTELGFKDYRFQADRS
jgi:hypothetical protein